MGVKSQDNQVASRMKLFPLFFLPLSCPPPASPFLAREGELCDICIDLVKPNDA